MSIYIPIKNQKKRNVKFPNKRNNYKRYNNAPWQFDDVFNEFELLKNNNVHKCTKYISF